jgi:hypothetical protein
VVSSGSCCFPRSERNNRENLPSCRERGPTHKRPCPLQPAALALCHRELYSFEFDVRVRVRGSLPQNYRVGISAVEQKKKARPPPHTYNILGPNSFTQATCTLRAWQTPALHTSSRSFHLSARAHLHDTHTFSTRKIGFLSYGLVVARVLARTSVLCGVTIAHRGVKVRVQGSLVLQEEVFERTIVSPTTR